MGTFIKIPFPAVAGTLVNVYNVKTITRTSATALVIHFDDATILTVTNTSDTTFNTLKAFNDAMALARSPKSAPDQDVDVVLPSGISVSAVAVTLLT